MMNGFKMNFGQAPNMAQSQASGDMRAQAPGGMQPSPMGGMGATPSSGGGMQPSPMGLGIGMLKNPSSAMQGMGQGMGQGVPQRFAEMFDKVPMQAQSAMSTWADKLAERRQQMQERIMARRAALAQRFPTPSAGQFEQAIPQIPMWDRFNQQNS